MFCCCFFSALLYFVVGKNEFPSDYINDEVSYNSFNVSYISENMPETEQKFPYKSNKQAGECEVISLILPDNLEDNMVINLRPDQLDTKVYIDGILRVDYSTKYNRHFGKVSPRRYIFMPVNREDSGKLMIVELTTAVSKTGSFDILSYGDKYDVITILAKDSTADIIIAFIMLIISILCLIGGIILSIGLKSFVEITYLAIMSMEASVWILCNAEISQLYFVNMTITMNIDYIMLMLLPFPFLFFMDKVQNKKFTKIYRIFEYVAIIESMTCIGLTIFKVVDLSQMFILIAAVLGSSLIMILVTICVDIFKCKNYSYAIITFGILAGVAAALIQMALFLCGRYSFGGKAVAIALLIILFTSIINTFRKIRDNENEKSMAVAQSKAESNFLANMSHEIRTPINAVLGLNEMVLRETKESQILEYAQNIDNSGKMLLAIVNDILDLSKIRSGKMKIISDKYSLYAIVQSVRDMIEAKATDKNLDFSIMIDESIPNNLIGDDTRIKQIIINVLNNAVKYTDKGKVSLDISGASIEDDSVLLKIMISDTGRGIKEEDLSSLFDAFARVDEKKNKTIEGTGLGLALVKNLVEAMNGTISVDSIYGKGSTFIIEIPQKKYDNVSVANAKTEEKKEKEDINKTALFTAPTAKILVTDDVKVNLTVVKSLLKRTEIKVTAVLSGKDCIEALKANDYDVIFLDHLMPQMDGIETLEIIKRDKLADDTPIIVLTANVIAGAKEQYLAHGFNDYLTKPIKSEDLEEMLLKYIPESKIETINKR